MYIWQLDALCVGTDPELFCALPGSRDETAARMICAECPVRADCLADAYAEGDDTTIRGGLTADERRARRVTRLTVSA